MSLFHLADGGTNDTMHVDENRNGHTFSITQTERENALDGGNAFNINTGYIGLTANTASGVLHYVHKEDNPLIIDAVAFAADDAATTVTQAGVLTIIRNPLETGTVFTTATAVDMNGNMNFSSNNTLSSSLAYKGAEAETILGGTNVAILQFTAGTRVYAQIPMELKKGNSIGITMNTYTTSGTTNVYCALVCHLKDPKNK